LFACAFGEDELNSCFYHRIRTTHVMHDGASPRGGGYSLPRYTTPMNKYHGTNIVAQYHEST